MHTESFEIYSDATNAAVMRHPERKSPGVLVQGDTLHSLCVSADLACAGAQAAIDQDDFKELNKLRNHLRSLLNHYKSILCQHNIRLPFSETPAAR